MTVDISKRKQISNVGPGWIWRYKGEESYLTSEGKISKSRHAINMFTGEVVSEKQIRNKQLHKHPTQIDTLPPKAIVSPRLHSFMTRQEQDIQRNKIDEERAKGKKPMVMRKPSQFGQEQALLFNNLDEVKIYAQNYGTGKYSFLMFQVKYNQYIGESGGQKDGSDKMDENHYGYASLSGWIDKKDFDNFSGKPWENIENNYKKYELGPQGYVSVLFVEHKKKATEE